MANRISFFYLRLSLCVLYTCMFFTALTFNRLSWLSLKLTNTFQWQICTLGVPSPLSVHRICYSSHAAYSQSKLALVLFTYHLQEQLTAGGFPVTVNAVDPGMVDTALYNNLWTLAQLLKKPVAKILFRVRFSEYELSSVCNICPSVWGSLAVLVFFFPAKWKKMNETSHFFRFDMQGSWAWLFSMCSISHIPTGSLLVWVSVSYPADSSDCDQSRICTLISQLHWFIVLVQHHNKSIVHEISNTQDCKLQQNISCKKAMEHKWVWLFLTVRSKLSREQMENNLSSNRPFIIKFWDHLKGPAVGSRGSRKYSTSSISMKQLKADPDNKP